MAARKNVFSAFNPKRFITLSIKYWYIYAAAVAACCAAALLLSGVRQPKKEVLAQLVLKEDTGSSSMFMAGQIARSFSLGDMFGGTSTTDNETFVMRSHTVFAETARQMGLNTCCYEPRLGVLWKALRIDPPLRLLGADAVSDTLSVSLVFKLSKVDADTYNVKVKKKFSTIAEVRGAHFPISVATPYGDFTIAKTDYFNPSTATNYKITLCSYDAAAEGFAKLVDIFVPDRKSDFIDLSFVTPDPEFGKDLLSHIIANYTAISNVYKADRSSQSLRLVDERLASLADELVLSEGAIESFKQQNDLTDLEADAQYLMTRTGMLEQSLLEAQTKFEIVKMTRDFISNPENSYSMIPDLLVTSGATTDGSGSLINQYNALILERMQLLSSAKDGNAAVKLLDQQIDAMRANIVSSIDRVYANAKLTLDDLRSESGKNKTRIGQIPAIERQYMVLKRDNLLQEQIYLFLLQQREELTMNIASRAQPAQVIDEPHEVVEPHGLTRMVMLALGLVIGALLAAAYVLMALMPRKPVKAANEAEALLTAPHLAPIGPDKTGTVPSVAGGSNASDIRLLRSQVLAALAECGGKAVAVTSINPGEGRTYIAANLAASMAMAGKRTAAIDLDFSNPHLAAELGDANCPAGNLADYVRGNATQATPTAVEVPGGSVDVFSASDNAADSADIVANERFAQLMARLAADYDAVVVDSPALKGHSDAYTLTALCDLTLLACRGGVTTPADFEQINALYADGRLKRLAVVENSFK